MSFGVGEIVVILFVLVVVFSASRMGQLGNALGKFVYSFRKAARGQDFVDASRASSRLEARRPPPASDEARIGEPHARD